MGQMTQLISEYGSYGPEAFCVYPGGGKLVNPGSFHPTQARQPELAKLVNGCPGSSVSCWGRAPGAFAMR